ncbi:MAG: hypothetical protein FH761_10440 [Firmicutes bacterium]|nr:hypothetical protein [Bacillota bacterium]
MAKEMKRGNVVDEHQIGNTKIKVFDTYFPKTREEHEERIESLERTLGRIKGCKVKITYEGEYKYLDRGALNEEGQCS